MDAKKSSLVKKKLDENYKNFCESVNDVVNKTDGYHNVMVPYLEKEGFTEDKEVQQYLAAFEEAKKTALELLTKLNENEDVKKILKEKGVDSLTEPLAASGKLIQKP